MKKLFLFLWFAALVVALLLSCVGPASAAYRFDAGNTVWVAATNSCADFKAVWNAWAVTAVPGATVASCSTDPISSTTTYHWVDGISSGDWGFYSVTFFCATGTHLDSSTNTCVDDITIAVASCMPSIRTISPCPSGYAPTNAIPAGSGAPNPFISDMDGMPLQDMIYAVGVAICGLMGIAVGVKLV